MSTHSSIQYVRLRNLPPNNNNNRPNYEVEAMDGGTTQNIRRRGFKFARFGMPLLLISLFLNCMFAWKFRGSSSHGDRTLTYSPALSAIKNERVVFSSAFGIERSPFQGQPAEENDNLWASLYDFGISRISMEEAHPMDNKTLPVPDEDGGYIIQLSVFHQLHCLNMIRKGLYGAVDMTNEDDLMGIEHLDHCVDMLRQSIMCNSDVTPITFARTSLDTSMKVVAEVVHTCRSFSEIQQWAWNRRITSPIDKDKVVTGDPLGWGTYTYTP